MKTRKQKKLRHFVMLLASTGLMMSALFSPIQAKANDGVVDLTPSKIEDGTQDKKPAAPGAYYSGQVSSSPAVSSGPAAYRSVSLSGSKSENVFKGGLPFYSPTIKGTLIESEGGFWRVEYTGGRLIAENYDANGSLLSSRNLPLGFPVYGGVFAGSKYNYVVSGQNNEQENAGQPSLCVQKFDKNWNLMQSANLVLDRVRVPFSFGTVSMSESNGVLFIHTSREIFTSPDGLNHQSSLSVMLDADSLAQLDMAPYNTYVSHSLGQLVKLSDEDIYLTDVCDGSGRGIAMARFPLFVDESHPYRTRKTVFAASGAQGEFMTGISLGGMELSDAGVLVAASTTDQNSQDKTGTRNVLVSYSNKELSVTENRLITSYSGGTTAREVRLCKVNGSSFVLLWEEVQSGGTKTKVCTINAKGERTSEIKTFSAPLSDVRPVLFSDGTIRWFSCLCNEAPVLHILNPSRISEISESDGTGAGVGPSAGQNGDRVEMHRLYNPNSGEHFYTASDNEKNTLVSCGWKFEGRAWIAPKSSSVPVYRLYNPNAGDHHYTTDASEKNVLVSIGWKDEGIGWHSDEAKGTPVWRTYNPNAVSGSHHYTTDRNEYDTLGRIGWICEGTGWHGLID